MLPKRIFQALAVVVVFACSFGGIAIAAAGFEPFATVAAATSSPTFAWLLGLLLGLLVSLALIVPLRMLSDMRPVGEDFAELRKLSIADIQRERARLDAMRSGEPAERRRFHLWMAAGSFCCLFVGGAIVAATYESTGSIYAFAIAILIYGVFGPPIHLALAYFEGHGR